MTCESAMKRLSLFLYGELAFDEEDLLEQHLESCELCRRELERSRQLHAMMASAQDPLPPGLLVECRRQFRSEVLPAAAEHDSWWQRVRLAFSASQSWSPLAATALLTIGFLAGKFMGPVAAGGDWFNHAGLGPVASRVRTVEPSTAGTVRIVVEETRERRLSGGLEDSRIRDLVLEAAREANDPGLRVESMEILRAHSESAEVRRALLAALEQDPNPGVRLKALEGLKPFAQDAGTRQALARVLLRDDNAGVRIQAIDLLIQRKEPGMAGVLQESLARESNGYVRQRCERALRDMNASVETF